MPQPNVRYVTTTKRSVTTVCKSWFPVRSYSDQLQQQYSPRSSWSAARSPNNPLLLTQRQQATQQPRVVPQCLQKFLILMCSKEADPNTESWRASAQAGTAAGVWGVLYKRMKYQKCKLGSWVGRPEERRAWKALVIWKCDPALVNLGFCSSLHWVLHSCSDRIAQKTGNLTRWISQAILKPQILNEGNNIKKQAILTIIKTNTFDSGFKSHLYAVPFL